VNEFEAYVYLVLLERDRELRLKLDKAERTVELYRELLEATLATSQSSLQSYEVLRRLQFERTRDRCAAFAASLPPHATPEEVAEAIRGLNHE
jgi:hypothetical protein